jgi:hypothetical protein
MYLRHDEKKEKVILDRHWQNSVLKSNEMASHMIAIAHNHRIVINYTIARIEGTAGSMMLKHTMTSINKQ